MPWADPDADDYDGNILGGPRDVGGDDPDDRSEVYAYIREARKLAEERDAALRDAAEARKDASRARRALEEVETAFQNAHDAAGRDASRHYAELGAERMKRNAAVMQTQKARALLTAALPHLERFPCVPWDGDVLTRVREWLEVGDG